MGIKMVIPVTIPVDEDGMLGRECLECEQYFKIKPGTGLPTSQCHCPYCEYEGNADKFWTQDQLEYARSLAINQAIHKTITPSLRDFTNTLKGLQRGSQNSLVKFKVKIYGQDISLPVKYYSEKELETTITCDSCGLVFSIYGVFARCPDCNELNAFLIFEKSLEVSQKQVAIFSNSEIPKEVKEQSLFLALSSCISAFDGLGKELRISRPDLYPDKPKNLFQNLLVLDEKLNGLLSKSHSNFGQLLKLFQVRHIFEHNMGVVDEDFVNKLPQYSNMLKRKYALNLEEVNTFIKLMRELGEIVKEHFKQNQTMRM